MNNENSEITNIPQPKPSWDYYILWHKLYKAKAHLDKLIAQIAPIQESSTDQDIEINQKLDDIVAILDDSFIEISEEDDE